MNSKITSNNIINVVILGRGHFDASGVRFVVEEQCSLSLLNSGPDVAFITVLSSFILCSLKLDSIGWLSSDLTLPRFVILLRILFIDPCILAVLISTC